MRNWAGKKHASSASWIKMSSKGIRNLFFQAFPIFFRKSWMNAMYYVLYYIIYYFGYKSEYKFTSFCIPSKIEFWYACIVL